MKRASLKFLPLLILTSKVYFVALIRAEIEDDTWMDPDAWARDYLTSSSLQKTNSECCKCSEDMLNEPSDPKESFHKRRRMIVEDEASLIYLKKFITMLFNRKNFKYDSTQQTYERSIVLTVQSCQMDKLERLQDPRDLDSILVEVFKNVRTPNMCRDGQQELHLTETSTAFNAIALNILYDVWQLINISEIRFLIIVAAVILIALIFSNRFNIGWLPIVFGGVFIYGYLHTYLECNRELEVNEMLEILNRDKGSEKSTNGFKILNFFKGMFYTDDIQQKIKQNAKLSLGFCRPDHVLIIYFNDIFLKYLQVLIEQCTVTLTTLNGALGFPYNIISGFILVYMILYISKLTFKYILSPSAWAQFMHPKQLSPPEQAAIKNNVNSEHDRISGNNLKLLLNAINATTQRSAIASTSPVIAAVSGVENISEAIESNSENIASQLDESSVEKSNNNISNENHLDKKPDFKIEDACEDS